jgi:hypothetical protein
MESPAWVPVQLTAGMTGLLPRIWVKVVLAGMLSQTTTSLSATRPVLA